LSRDRRFDRWFDYETSAIEFGLLCILEGILKNPSRPLERVILDRKPRPLFDSIILKWSWTIFEDLQNACRQSDPTKLAELANRIRELKEKAVNVETLIALADAKRDRLEITEIAPDWEDDGPYVQTHSSQANTDLSLVAA
jgi:hypothetical protein